MSGLQIAAAVVGALMLAEGAALLSLREESWRKLCEYLSAMTAGQAHTAGIALVVCGGLLVGAALL